MLCRAPERPPSAHQADDHTGAGKRWRLTALLLFGPCRCERIDRPLREAGPSMLACRPQSLPDEVIQSQLPLLDEPERRC